MTHDLFFKELRNKIDSFESDSRYNRRCVPLVEEMYKRYKQFLCAELCRFIRLGILMHPECDKAKKYKTSIDYGVWKDYWLEHIHHRLCPQCGNRIKSKSLIGSTAHTFCSNKCKGKSLDVELKRMDTCMKKYGTINLQTSAVVKNKRKKTMQDRYGGYTLQSPTLRKKVKTTMVEKYGTEHALACPEIYDKVQATKLIKYGGNTYGSHILMKKVDSTMINKYGVKQAFQSKEIRAKIESDRLARTGYANPMQNPEVRARAGATNMRRYGYAVVTKSPVIKAKTQRVMQQRYGVDSPMQHAASRMKQQQSAKRILTYVIEGRTYLVQSEAEYFFALAAVKQWGIKNVHSQFHKEFPSYAWSELGTFPDFYLDHSDTFVEIKSSWTFMGREGIHQRALTEGDLRVNRVKARVANESGNIVRWVIVVAKDRFLTLPLDWYDTIDDEQVRRLVDDFVS